MNANHLYGPCPSPRILDTEVKSSNNWRIFEVASLAVVAVRNNKQWMGRRSSKNMAVFYWPISAQMISDGTAPSPKLATINPTRRHHSSPTFCPLFLLGFIVLVENSTLPLPFREAPGHLTPSFIFSSQDIQQKVGVNVSNGPNSSTIL